MAPRSSSARGRRCCAYRRGGHFFSDVVFGGVVVFLLIWLVHGLALPLAPTRLSDAGVERALERIATPGYDAVMRIAARIRGTAPRG